jgi:hypothetical protein
MSTTKNQRGPIETTGSSITLDSASNGGSTKLLAPDLAADNTFTLPTPTSGTTDVLVGRNTTDTLENKTFVAPALGTPASGVLTNATGLPVSTGIAGLGTGVATLLATPTSANLKAAITDETGTGALVFAESPTLVTPALGTPSALVLTNATGLPVTSITGLGTGVATLLATPSSANLRAAITDETGSGVLVFADTPTLISPVLGAATGTSLALGGSLGSAKLKVIQSNDTVNASYGIDSAHTVDAAAGTTTGNQLGVLSSVIVDSGASQDISGQVAAGYFDILNQGTGTTTSAAGVYALITAGGSSTITTAASILAKEPTTVSSGAITNSYSILSEGESRFQKSLVLDQLTTPANPPAGQNKLYFKSNETLYSLASDGTETPVGFVSGSSAQYVKGDHTLGTLATDVAATAAVTANTSAISSLVIGTDVQAQNSKLQAFADLSDGSNLQVLTTDGSEGYSWSTVATDALDEQNIKVGNSGTAAAVDTSSVGDILADDTNGLTIKSGVIVNADINASAAIAGSKIVSASDSVPGVVTISAQTFSGVKTFDDGVNLGDNTLTDYIELDYENLQSSPGLTGVGSGGGASVWITKIGRLVTMDFRISTGSSSTSNQIFPDSAVIAAAYRPSDSVYGTWYVTGDNIFSIRIRTNGQFDFYCRDDALANENFPTSTTYRGSVSWRISQ